MVPGRPAHRVRSAAEAALVAGRELADRSGGIATLADPVRRALLCALGASTDSSLSHGDIEAVLSFADERASVAAGFDERVHLRAPVDGALALRLVGHNGDAEARCGRCGTARRHVLPQATLEVGALFGTVLRSLRRLVDEAVAEECTQLGVRLVEFGPSRAFAIVLQYQIEVSRGDWRRAVDGLLWWPHPSPIRITACRPTWSGRRHSHWSIHSLPSTRSARPCPLHSPTPRRVDVSVAVLRRRPVAPKHWRERRCHGCPCPARFPRHASVGRLRCALFPAGLRRADDRRRARIGCGRCCRSSHRRRRASGSRARRVRARLDLGALLARSDRGRAVEAMCAAGADAQRLGARTEQQLAERALRSLGVRTWRRGAGGDSEGQVSALTDRSGRSPRW